MTLILVIFHDFPGEFSRNAHDEGELHGDNLASVLQFLQGCTSKEDRQEIQISAFFSSGKFSQGWRPRWVTDYWVLQLR